MERLLAAFVLGRPYGTFIVPISTILPAVNCWATVGRPYGTKFLQRTYAVQRGRCPGLGEPGAFGPDMAWFVPVPEIRAAHSQRRVVASNHPTAYNP